MAFGFVVEKFSLFLLLDKSITKGPRFSALEISNLLGVIFIILGIIIGFLAMVRFIRVEQEIETNTFRPPLVLDILCGLIFLLLSIFICYYVINWHNILLMIE